MASCRHRYPWPGGWPRLFQSCQLLELCLPLREDLSLLRNDTEAPAQPCGLVPGWRRGGAALKQFVIGGKIGLNCVFAILFMVFNGKFRV
jgi:hypothetical protein